MPVSGPGLRTGGPARTRVTLALAAALVLPCLCASEARAAGRLAVLILPEPGTDAALADNLTEIAIARIAERQGVQMAGTVELRRRLQMEGSRPALGCLSDLACLGRVAVALGVERVVGGSVRALEGSGFLLNLTLTEVASGVVAGRFFREVPGGVPALIAAIQEGADILFKPRTEPGRIRVESEPPRARVSIDDLFVGNTPVLSEALLPGLHSVRVEKENRVPWQERVLVQPGSELQIKLRPDQLPALRRWPRAAVITGLIVSTALLGAGGVLGVLSQNEPETDVRITFQRDIARRQAQARQATWLLGAGAGVGAVSLAVMYAYRSDIFTD